MSELATVYSLYRVFRREKIEAVLSYTPKGNIYGAFAAMPIGIPTIANISGLGKVFVRRGLLTVLVKGLYWLAFRRTVWVFFQNREDMELFAHLSLVPASKIERIPGSGVDVRRFSPFEVDELSDIQVNNCRTQDAQSVQPFRKSIYAGDQPFVFLLIARMLWDKGIGEYVKAARRVLSLYPSVRLQLLGFLDVDNPSAIPRERIDAWVNEGVVEYLGSTDDVVPVIRDADCVVLPSYYREGVPRTLLESASMAKPLITTDTPGCRDAVEDGVTGFLCKAKNVEDLAEKMIQMIELPKEDRHVMGLRAREKMLREFNERIVIERYLDVVSRISKRFYGK